VTPDIVVPLVDPTIDPITHPTTVIITPRQKIKRLKRLAMKRILPVSQLSSCFLPSTRRSMMLTS
jgi:hypothetical protein